MIQAHTGPVIALSVSADGKFLVTYSHVDSRLKFWQVIIDLLLFFYLLEVIKMSGRLKWVFLFEICLSLVGAVGFTHLMHFHVASCPELLMEQFLNKISLTEAIQIYAESVDF